MRFIKDRTDDSQTASARGACSVEAFVGVSAWVKSFREEILRIAPHASTVLICGPSGTGKELAADGRSATRASLLAQLHFLSHF
jgi:DNA-binding NtrC family response regulator